MKSANALRNKAARIEAKTKAATEAESAAKALQAKREALAKTTDTVKRLRLRADITDQRKKVRQLRRLAHRKA